MAARPSSLELPREADREGGRVAVLRADALVFGAEREIPDVCLHADAERELVVPLVYLIAAAIHRGRLAYRKICALVGLQPRHPELAVHIEKGQRQITNSVEHGRLGMRARS